MRWVGACLIKNRTMTLKEFIENLQELAEQYPEALELEVITSKDDEGNGYNAVFYSPSVGVLDGDDFRGIDYEVEKRKPTVVCVN